MDDNKIVDELNNVEFVNFENIKMGTQFRYWASETKREEKLLKGILRIIGEVFFSKYNIEVYGSGNVCFFYSLPLNARADQWAYYQEIMKLVKNKVCVFQGKWRWSFNYSYVELLIKWYRAMKRTSLKKAEKLYVIYVLLHVWSVISEIEKKKINSKALVVYCDNTFAESIVVQYFNDKMDTISLQHGVFSSYENADVIKNSKSKYLLVYGKFTRDECIRVGMTDEKIKCLGMPKLVYEEQVTKFEFEEIKTVGIVFECTVDVDLQMLNMAKKCFGNVNLIVKLHPASNISHYPKISATEIYHTEISSYDFIKKCDIVICHYSTLGIEALLQLKPLCLFQSGTDVYPNVSWCKFKNEKELQLLIKQYTSNKQVLQENVLKTRNYFSEAENVRENYMAFFGKYDI